MSIPLAAKAAKRAAGEGGFQTREKDGWVRGAKMIDGTRRYTRWYPTRLAATSALRVLTAPVKLAEPEPEPEAKPTLAEAVAGYIVYGSVDASTRGSYEFALHRYIGPELGGTPIAELTTDDFAVMYDRLAVAGRALSVLRQTRAVVYGAYTFGIFRKWVTVNVARGIKLPEGKIDDAQEVLPFSDEERELLLRQMTGTRFEARHRLALELGLRPSEALGLRWSRVDFKAGKITVNGQLQRMRVVVDGKPLGVAWKSATKSAAGVRTLEPGPRTMGLLVMLKAQQDGERATTPLTRSQVAKREVGAKRLARAKELGLLAKKGRYSVPPEDLCFTLANGDPVLQAQDTLMWAQLCAAAGVEHRSLYSARHTAFSYLIRNGADLLSVSVLAGHTDMAFTARVYGGNMSQRSHSLASYFEGAERFD